MVPSPLHKRVTLKKSKAPWMILTVSCFGNCWLKRYTACLWFSWFYSVLINTTKSNTHGSYEPRFFL